MFSGADRYDTALQNAYNTLTTSKDNPTKVYVASGTKFADALAGGALAAHNNADIILASPTGIKPDAPVQLKAEGITEAVILGGTASVPSSVETAFAEAGIKVKRIAGKDRYETSKMILEDGWGKGYTGKVMYASGENFADALAAVPAAAKLYVPIMLTGKNDTTQPMTNPGWVVGGPNAVAYGAWATPKGGVTAEMPGGVAGNADMQFGNRGGNDEKK